MTAPIASGWSKIAGWDSHPLENAAFARRTPKPEVYEFQGNVVFVLYHDVQGPSAYLKPKTHIRHSVARSDLRLALMAGGDPAWSFGV